MTAFGFTLSSEESGPARLVELAGEAEDAGFDFLTISDHFHPWVDRQGHSPFVWSTLGGVSTSTSTIAFGTGVTCPILRIHPAIVAQAAATTSALSGGRFFLGVGTGELLNEHVTGLRWPVIEERRAMLLEAIEVMRALWTGEAVDFHGEHFTVENARIYDPPSGALPVIMAAAGPATATRAADVADGLWVTSPDREVIAAYRDAGGAGHVYGQVTVCVGADAAEQRKVALEWWPTAGLPGQLSQELPSPPLFEQAASLVTEEQVAAAVVCGPDAGPIAERVQQYVDAGVDHVHLHQVGPDQGAFFDLWAGSLQATVRG
jgi:coenzyme F420-dependent glucose-6-phosphate dehydrogenase